MDNGKANRSPAGAWYTLPPGTPVLRCSLAELDDDEFADIAWLFAVQGGWVALRQGDYHHVVLWAGTVALSPPSDLIEWSDLLRNVDDIYERIARGGTALVRRGDMTLLLESTVFLTPLGPMLATGVPLDHIEQWLELGEPWDVPATGVQIFFEIPLEE